MTAEPEKGAEVCEAEVAEFLAGLRRRREAAQRLPPMETGYRDPWDVGGNVRDQLRPVG